MIAEMQKILFHNPFLRIVRYSIHFRAKRRGKLLYILHDILNKLHKTGEKVNTHLPNVSIENALICKDASSMTYLTQKLNH